LDAEKGKGKPLQRVLAKIQPELEEKGCLSSLFLKRTENTIFISDREKEEGPRVAQGAKAYTALKK